MSQSSARSAIPKHGDSDRMKCIAGGEFLMGCENYYPEEAPIRRSAVGEYWIDEFPVTNRQFEEFADATQYKTLAEAAPDPKDYPGMPHGDGEGRIGGIHANRRTVPLNDPCAWWKFVFGADWRHPLGPHSSIAQIMDHPVVQIAYEDANAYAKWVGRNYRPKRNGNSRPAVA